MVEEKKKSDLIVILKTQNQIYAEMVKEALEKDDIPVLLKSTMGHNLRGMLPFQQDFFNYSLYIQSQFKEAALEIVNTIVPKEEIL